MGTLKVDNIQTESGSAVITNGVIPSTLVSGIGTVSYTHLTLPTILRV